MHVVLPCTRTYTRATVYHGRPVIYPTCPPIHIPAELLLSSPRHSHSATHRTQLAAGPQDPGESSCDACAFHLLLLSLPGQVEHQFFINVFRLLGVGGAVVLCHLILLSLLGSVHSSVTKARFSKSL